MRAATTSSATLVDAAGVPVQTAEFSKKWIKRFKKRLGGEPIEVLAKEVKWPVKKGEGFVNRLEIKEVRSGATPLRQLQATPDEKVIVNNFIKTMRKEIESGNRWALRDAVEEAAIEEIGIVGTQLDAAYMDAIRAVVCQAFSGGKIDKKYNGKVHICIIGPPASGKKLLWHIAEAINVVSEESQAIRVSPAGLGVGIEKGKDGWQVKIGKLPKANHGAHGFQDFDKCKNKDEVLPIMSRVMEDGDCILTGIRTAATEALTGLYIDVNRSSDINLHGKRPSIVEDIGIPTYILSRLDFIIEFQKDVKLQAEKAQLRLKRRRSSTRPKSLIGTFCKKHKLDIRRFLPLLVAYTMEECQTVNLNSVMPYIKEKFLQISMVNKGQIEALDELAAFEMRMVNSIEKMVRAFTRMQLTTEANREAVDMAFHLLQPKLEFLRNIAPELKVPAYKEVGKEALGGWLFLNYGETTFSPKEAFKEYKAEGKPHGPVGERQFRDWLKLHCEMRSHGKWAIREEVFSTLQAHGARSVKYRPRKR